MSILLHDRHPNRLKISRATISQRTDPVTKCSLASVWVSSDHERIRAVVRNKTCKKCIYDVLLKTKSFLQFQMVHSKAQTPTRICLTKLGSILLSHVPNKALTEYGGLMLKAMWTVCQSTLASGQSKKRCLIVSSRSQKLHLVGPVQLRFIKFCLVKITCL